MWPLLLLGSPACEWPFETRLSPGEDLFVLDIEYDQRRIVDTLHVRLTWSELTVEYFDSYLIERRNMDRGDTSWTEAAKLSDPFATAFVDTIDDDATFLYRVRIVDQDMQYRTAESQVTIAQTSRLVVPTEVGAVADATASPVMDDGDTVFVLPGAYQTSPIHYLNKRLYLIATDGAARTVLDASSYFLPGAPPEPVVTMSGGLLQGFTITGGEALRGGGIFAEGEAVIRQCAISNNTAVRSEFGSGGGLGGGLHITDSVRVENCVIWNNTAESSGGGFYIGGYSPTNWIFNCTVYQNGPQGILVPISSGATIENCIVLNNEPAGNIRRFGPTAVRYTNSSPTWVTIDSTNIFGDPLFVESTNGDFRLLPGSPCIDAGNPDPAYTDPDGSPNDMGAFGGPYGDWQATGSPDP